ILKKRVSAEAKLNIDIDWFYRKCGLMFLKVCGNVYAFRSLIQSLIQEALKEVQLLGLNPVNLKRVFLSKKTKPAKTYDPDIYRHPVGLGISIFLALYVIMTLILLFFL
ncbi:hypothetical protein, partial [Escherichia coli]|uniref:hypothetical protein n=1 Tax=Escherichia coli TaxID=562 RepID=UPI0019601684